MPGRIMPLVNGEVYHVFNRGANRQPTFSSNREYERALTAIDFYRFYKTPLSLSKFLKLEQDRQNEILDLLHENKRLVDIFCYCLMPNHFHILLRQQENNGISKFLSNFQNSYTKYFNARHERDGSLFLDQFKAVRVETDEQLVHLSRYIHLNPHTGFVTKTLEGLETYPWSSFQEYLEPRKQFTNVKFILDFFKSGEEYKKFVFDQADYQRKLKLIEHLVIE